MEDEDRLLADDTPRDSQYASTSGFIDRTETDPLKLLQKDMHCMATSMQKMSDAWTVKTIIC